MAKMLHSGFLLFLFCALQTNAVPAIVPPSSDFDSLSLLRPVDSTEPDALLKFVVAELERSKREAGTLGMCEGIEVAHIMEKHHKVENGIKYEISLKMKPVHIVTDSCNNKPVKNVIPSTIEDCQIEVWEGGHSRRRDASHGFAQILLQNPTRLRRFRNLRILSLVGLLTGIGGAVVPC